MKKLFLFCLLIAGPQLGRTQGTVFFNVFLDGPSMVPPNASSNTGSGSLSLNGLVFSYLIPLPGVAATAASIFGPAFPGQTGPELAALNRVLVAPGINGEPGLVSFSGNRMLNSGEIDQLNAGLWYVVVNTTGFPGGELRGQIVGVPEPGTVALLLLGLLFTCAVRGRLKPNFR
ncbi:MAG: CHRD domain-containing protein [Verrucomicrobia bacterium]|nr:CHRD domain-containing protein [Verrucomicrobiota bacterium]